ncbi:MAG: DUF1697 domain-containing protein [Planctomycetaceae bacterium]
MSIYIALFRGINVGGRNSLPMKELTSILEELGATGVKTYIQSGNVVFASREKNTKRLAGKIGAEIKNRRGFEPAVLLLTSDDLKSAIEANPFPETEGDPKSLHLGFLDTAPNKPDLKKLDELKANGERFQLIGKVFYLHAPNGVGRSKLAANVERLLGVTMTDRNWRTVCKLSELESL